MNLKGSISIYFTLCIVLIISIILSVTELARVNAMKLNLQIATDAAIDSMLSLYHRKLYEFYNVYGVEYRTDELLTKEYFNYLSPFFVDENDGEKIANWYNAYISEEKVNLRHNDLTSNTYFEREIIDYMKYAIIGKTIKFFGKEINIDKIGDANLLLDEARKVFNETKETEIYSELYNRYFDYAPQIKQIEKYEKEILKDIYDANSEMDSLGKMSASGTLSNLKDVEKKINKLKGHINNLLKGYSNLTDSINRFLEIIEKNKRLYNEDKLSNKYKFNEDIEEFIESEFNQFESYVSFESHIRGEINKGNREVSAITSGFNEIVRNIEDYISDLEYIESEIKDAKKEKGDDYDADYIHELNDEKRDMESDASEYLKDVRESFGDIKFSELDFDISKNEHSSEENLLNKLLNFKNNVLLDFIFSNDKMSTFSNETIGFIKHDLFTDSPYISLNKILLGEYALDKFNYYDKDKNDEKTTSNSKRLEVERLIIGKNSDRENISGTINSIFLIRVAMNMLYIFKSPEMRSKARGFSYAIFGGFSRLLAEAMFLLSIAAWASAESIIDLKRLVNGVRVNFMHDSSSWSVSINSILDIARGNIGNVSERDDDGVALSYKDYLRLILLNTNQSLVNSRMAEIMEYNVKNEEETFDFEKLVAAFDVKNEFLATHYFTNFLFIKAKNVILKNEYKVETSGYNGFTK